MVRHSMMVLRRQVFLWMVAGASSWALTAPVMASSRSLSVDINGLKNRRGQVCMSLFGSAQGFPMSATRALDAKCVKVSQANSVTFNRLVAGTYAIAVFHDANGDGTLNRNRLGIPTEGFGFSRNPRIVSGPPSFGDSAVFVGGAGQRIKVRLQYLWGN